MKKRKWKGIVLIIGIIGLISYLAYLLPGWISLSLIGIGFMRLGWVLYSS